MNDVTTSVGPSNHFQYTYQLAPTLQTHGLGFCLGTQYQLATSSQSWNKLVSQYQFCPGGVAAAPPAGARVLPVPAVLAGMWWETHGVDVLPRPRPRIAPGYALAGNPAYLETNAPLTATFGSPTPIGTLSVTAHGTIWANWGDGSGWTGPYDIPGAPWPTGRITHVWTTASTYDVVVQERWTATWSLAGSGGGLTGLTTESALPAFSVRQLESVRNR